jgi:phenol hydroxylase P0 protein
VDVRAKFVRLLERRPDGLVSFEFSIGWPELAVELVLPTAAFDEFCARDAVIWRDDPSLDNTTTGDTPR